MKVIHTDSFKETQSIGQNLASQILAKKPGKKAVVLALSGDLGAGKTTFLQGFARGLGIKEIVNSPTFVIMKKFKIKKPTLSVLSRPRDLRQRWFYHFDCYRLEDSGPASAEGYGAAREILELGFREIISNPQNIVAIEWPEKIKKVMPKKIVKITFEHLEFASAVGRTESVQGSGEARENKREVSIEFKG